MEWTREQEKVIYYRNRNILVSAAAGSGKTAVLVERIIQRITGENPTDIDKLLVVTFTKAAAAEMRERIGDAIEKRLVEHPEDENLRRQQTLLHNAQITTIDSFCLFVVRNHFEEIHLDPNFRIADTGEMKLLEQDVLDEVFEAEFQRVKIMSEEKKSDSSFLELINAYSDKRSNKVIKDMVSKIYHQSASNPWPKEWIMELSQPYGAKTVEDVLSTKLIQGMFTYVKSILLDYPARLEELKHIALQPDGPQKYAEAIDEDIKSLEGIQELKDYSQLADFLTNLTFKSLPRITKYTGNPLKKEAVSGGRSAIKDEIKALKGKYFSLSMEELLEQLERMRPIAEELVRLSLLYLEAMEQKKAERHILGFSDVEHAALRILVDENTKELRKAAEEFKKQFDEIMIDEYQDSNQVQEEILCAISRESQGEYNMFMVGDVKQSIYRFRLARPELFMEKYGTYELNESKRQRIDLHKNFRSRMEVIDFTNDIFYKIMGKDIGEVSYDSEAALYVGANYPENNKMSPEVLLYETECDEMEIFEDEDRDDTEEDTGEALTKRQLEARMVAEKIIELKQTLQVTDKVTGELRPLQNRDIVILFRSLKGWGNDFASVLKECKIPAHVSTSTGYFSAIEVQTVLSFLKILDNPYQDIPMAAVLKSAIVGLDNEELAELSLTEGANSFSEAVLMALEEVVSQDTDGEETGTRGKLYRFKKLYDRLRSRVSDTPIHLLLEMVLAETGYGDYVKALPSGLLRSANLAMLLEKAYSYEKTSYKGLFHFVRYIDQLQKYEVDFGEADLIGENEDVVRLMTIHGSKGLEFPVVFVSSLSKGFNEMDLNEKLVIHPDMGFGMNEMRSNPRIKRSCIIRSGISNRIRQDNLGEELRVLYVALTRAKEKLILTGSIKNRAVLYEKYKGNIKEGKLLSFAQRVKAKSYLDWIAPAVLSYPNKYEFTFVSAEDLVRAEAKAEANRVLEKEDLLAQIKQADEGLVEELKRRLSYRYLYEQEVSKKSKYSVSEIKHRSMVDTYDRMEGESEIPEFLQEEYKPYIPAFAGENLTENPNENEGALRGTAVHRVMECFDFMKLLSLSESSIMTKDTIRNLITEELERMHASKLITSEMKALISVQALGNFLDTEVALRMAKAEKRGDLFREKPFVMDYEGALLQGIIDVFWLEGDRIVLLDYKTDRVEQAKELIQRYKVQLDLYGDALKRVFSTGEHRIAHSEHLIYSFKLNTMIEV